MVGGGLVEEAVERDGARLLAREYVSGGAFGIVVRVWIVESPLHFCGVAGIEMVRYEGTPRPQKLDTGVRIGTRGGGPGGMIKLVDEMCLNFGGEGEQLDVASVLL